MMKKHDAPLALRSFARGLAWAAGFCALLIIAGFDLLYLIPYEVFWTIAIPAVIFVFWLAYSQGALDEADETDGRRSGRHD